MVRRGTVPRRFAERAADWLAVAVRNARFRSAVHISGPPIPPNRLIATVAGTADIGWFLEGGRLAAQSIRSALARHGADIEQMAAVLDFGCGCGRVLRHWMVLPRTRVHGVDINSRLVAWCRKHLRFADVRRGKPHPPLGYADNTFDLVYALSVFTHLPEAAQREWLDELRRVLRPGGYLLLTVQGEHYRDELTQAERAQFDRDLLVVRAPAAAGTNRCATFHPAAYIREHLAEGFDLLEHLPEGAEGNPFQDLVLLRKPP